nr:hypothetical protein [Deltaproteobacteria bacterium]
MPQRAAMAASSPTKATRPPGTCAFASSAAASATCSKCSTKCSLSGALACSQ